MNGPVTPRMTEHARERCAQMGISTKVAKRIYQHADVVRTASHAEAGQQVATWDGEPDYAVLFGHCLRGSEIPVIITVFFRTRHDYIRNGTTYEVMT